MRQRALGGAAPLTPEEITIKRFHNVWRGWDPEEVAEFLGEVAADYEVALDEARRWRAVAEALGLADPEDPVTRR